MRHIGSFLVIISLISYSCTEVEKNLPEFHNDQANGARIFQPGLVSTGLHEHGSPVFAPGKDLFLWNISLNGHKIILEYSPERIKNANPEVANFSGLYRDEYPIFSPDGETVYFMSWRPDSIGNEPLNNFRHWETGFTGKKWEEPTINNKFHKDLWGYSMSADGNLWGWASFEEGRDDADIYFQLFEGKNYSEPVNAGDSINSAAIEYCPFISRDGNTLVFCRMGTGSLDGIYISLKDKDGIWSKAMRLPESVNLNASERFPSLSIDGRILYFNRQDRPYQPFSGKVLTFKDIINSYLYTPANGNIYYIDMKNIYKNF